MAQKVLGEPMHNRVSFHLVFIEGLDVFWILRAVWDWTMRDYCSAVGSLSEAGYNQSLQPSNTSCVYHWYL